MKKAVAIMAVVISTGVFANSDMDNLQNNRGGGRKGGMTKQLEAMTPEQQTEFKELHDAHRNSMKMSALEMKEVDLQIQKEMLAEKPNQSNLNKLIDKKAGLQADKQKEALAFKLEMKEKFDLDMKMDKGNKRGMMSKSKQAKGRNRG